MDGWRRERKERWECGNAKTCKEMDRSEEDLVAVLLVQPWLVTSLLHWSP
jgi:hypothetical protein